MGTRDTVEFMVRGRWSHWSQRPKKKNNQRICNTNS